MKTKKNRPVLKAPSKAPLSDYVRASSDIEPRTVRAQGSVWERISKLAEKQDCSMNELIVACLVKVCDDEGIS